MTRHDPDDGDLQPLAGLRGRVRRLVWWSGLGRTVAIVLGAGLVAGVLDWCWRYDDIGMRLLSAGTVWCTAGAALWRLLIRPLRWPLTDVLLAQQIERRFPGFGGRIAAALQFRARHCDPQSGSAELQQAVLRQALRELQTVSAADVTDPRDARRSLLAALAVSVVTGLVLIAYPLDAATAARRMVWPWSTAEWPRATVLQLLQTDGAPFVHGGDDPLRLVRGDTLTLHVANLRGGLPEQLWLERRIVAEEPPLREPLRRLPRTAVRGPYSELALLEITRIADPLEFRVVGGDDDTMPWQRLAVVDPPALADFQIDVQPPAYLGRETQRLPAGATEISGYLGSQVTISARANRPLKSVVLRRRDDAGRPVTLSDDQTSWTAALQIDAPGVVAYWFELQDPEGFSSRNPVSFEVRGQVDALPEVTLREPVSDQFVTPDAAIPLDISAQDDLGLRRLRLAWQREDAPPELLPLCDWPELPTSETFREEWKLADLQLKPGERLVFRAEALDACDWGEPHIGRSAPRTLTVVSPAEKLRELASRMTDVLEELREAESLQSRLRERTRELETQLSTVGGLRPEDRDALGRMDFEQRQIAERIAEPLRGLQSRVDRLRGEFSTNRVTAPEVEQHLEQLARQFDRLARDPLPAAERALTQAAKLAAGESAASPDEPPSPAEAPPKPKPASAAETAALPALQRAARAQDDVLESLAELRQSLGDWRADRDVRVELEQLVEEQRKLVEDTTRLGGETVAKSQAELSPQQRAELSKLSQRQRLEAQRVDQFRERLRNAAEQPTDAPRDAAELQEFAGRLEAERTTAKLRQAADDLNANRVGEAGALQREALSNLETLQQQLQAEQADDAEQLLKKIDQAAAEAAQLRAAQEELQRRADAGAAREEVSAAAQELRKRVERLERQLERLRLRDPAEAAERAARRLQSAAEQADAGDEDAASRQLHAARDELEQVQRDLARAQRQARERLAQEEFERLVQAVEALRQRQLGLIAETERLESVRQERGSWTRGQLRTLKDLASAERQVSVETGELIPMTGQAGVLQHVIRRALRDLERAAELLEGKETGPATLAAERAAATRLARLVDAWKEEAAQGEQPPPEGEQPPPNEENPSAPPPGESIPTPVQLRLLRSLLSDAIERTAQLATRPEGAPELTAAEREQLQELAAEHAELVQLVQELADRQRAPAAPPAAPDESPPPEKADPPPSR